MKNIRDIVVAFSCVIIATQAGCCDKSWEQRPPSYEFTKNGDILYIKNTGQRVIVTDCSNKVTLTVAYRDNQNKMVEEKLFYDEVSREKPLEDDGCTPLSEDFSKIEGKVGYVRLTGEKVLILNHERRKIITRPLENPKEKYKEYYKAELSMTPPILNREIEEKVKQMEEGVIHPLDVVSE